jgi:hypothetical protein
VLDDLQPVREMTSSIASAGVHLFPGVPRREAVSLEWHAWHRLTLEVGDEAEASTAK